MMHRHSRTFLLAAFAAAAILGAHRLATADGVPSTEDALVYEGTIERDGVPYDGSVEILVSFWSEATTMGPLTLSQVREDCGSGSLPTCRCAVSEAANVTAGRFSVRLGADCAEAVHEHPDLWVEVRGIAGGEEESFGRTALSAAPYALEAAESEEARYAHDSYDGVPIGGIVAWYRPPSGAGSDLTVPEGFVICDGGSVVPRGPMTGQTAPNLTSRFLMGVGSLGDVGTAGGATSYTANTSTDGEHYHVWGAFDDGADNYFTTITSDGERREQMYRTDDYSTQGAGRYQIAINDWAGVQSRVYVTGSDGDHEHSVRIDNVRPPHFGVLYLMRFE
ncbi:MAG: hypothetical protein AB8H86_04375 [Polyangiales bacterium]